MIQVYEGDGVPHHKPPRRRPEEVNVYPNRCVVGSTGNVTTVACRFRDRKEAAERLSHHVGQRIDLSVQPNDNQKGYTGVGLLEDVYLKDFCVVLVLRTP